MSLRTAAFVLIALAIVGTGCGIVGYSVNLLRKGSYLSAALMDPAYIGLFAFANAVLMLKFSDTAGASVSEACAIFTMAIVCVASCPTNMTRLLVALISSIFPYSNTLYAVFLGISAATTLAIGIISLIIAVQQARRIHAMNSVSYSVTTFINVQAWSALMIIAGLALFIIGVVILVKPLDSYPTVYINFHAVMLFATGVIGLTAHSKNSVDLHVWCKVLAGFSSGIGVTALLSLTQAVVVYNHYTPNFSKWTEVAFTAQCLSHCAFTVIGVVAAFVTATQLQLPLNEENQPTGYFLAAVGDSVNTGMMTSGLLACGIGAVSLALMNSPIFGFPTLVIGVMTYTASHLALAGGSSHEELVKRPFFALSVFNSIGAFYTINIIFFEYLVKGDQYSNIKAASSGYVYMLMAFNAVIMLVVAAFSVRAAVVGGKRINEELMLPTTRKI